ncbi:MAG: hypothetical protein EXR75_07445 [Myxococcales bacterium]|nr:hypothetical protein [Myxococcales bacterium]
MESRLHPLGRVLAVASLAGVFATACAPAGSPSSQRPVVAEKWFQRALGEYRRVAMDSAFDSSRQALELVPGDPEIQELAARVALARLEYDETLRLLKGAPGSTAAALRGRASWYKGDIERAADELEQLLADPDVEDSWAKQIAQLARRGAGRKPYDLSATEGQLASVEMTRMLPGSQPLFIVPLEIDGEQALAVVATGTPEVMIDSAARTEPSWISLRFGKRLEVRDVPALTHDLSGLSQQLGAPIKALLGANILRRLNVTLDYRGRQFVARAFTPPPPPVATRVSVFYVRGGGMVVGSRLGDRDNTSSPMLVDTSMGFSLAFDTGGWKKMGIETASLRLLGGEGASAIRAGTVPAFTLGAFTMPGVPAVFGPTFDKLERDLEVDLDGTLGAGMLAAFRVTLSDGGRVMWLEQSPPVPPAPPIDPQLLGEIGASDASDHDDPVSAGSGAGRAPGARPRPEPGVEVLR